MRQGLSSITDKNSIMNKNGGKKSIAKRSNYELPARVTDNTDKWWKSRPVQVEVEDASKHLTDFTFHLLAWAFPYGKETRLSKYVFFLNDHDMSAARSAAIEKDGIEPYLQSANVIEIYFSGYISTFSPRYRIPMFFKLFEGFFASHLSILR